MSAQDTKNPAKATLDRRTRPSLRDSIVEVKAAAVADLAAGRDTREAAALLEALARLEQRHAHPDHKPPSRKRVRGLSAARRLPFVAIAGVDRLSSLREEFGEPVAQRIVEVLCERIRECAEGVHLGRINRTSIEFSFFADDAERAEETLIALQQTLERPIPLKDRQVTLDVALGYAGRGADGDGLEVVVDRAEHALAKARATHAKLAVFTERDRTERKDRLALIRELRTAAADGELFVCYQPKLSLRTGRIPAAEALVRWRHPTRGLVAPDLFIGVAEESDQIRPITEAVVEQALIDRAALAAAGHPLTVFINMSGRLLADEGFAAWVLQRLGDQAGCIGFEITETAVIANPERALGHIRAFSDAGIAISIDDYGSGLSSLSYLKQIPAHELKIDRAFVSGLTSSHRDPLLVRSTIDLAHALDMEVTAEGVDNPMAMALLKAMGCDLVQGYHVSKPLAFADLAQFLTAFAPESLIRNRQVG